MLTLDVSKYYPNELRVSIVENILCIEGERVDEMGNSNCSSKVARQFSRKWPLPKDCRSELFTADLSSDGILIVTAPKY
jgi:HSP20 family molecular chaperone IbpA